MNTQKIEYYDGDTLLEGHLAWNDSDSGQRPVVLVAHDWTGRREIACQAAEQISSLGYIGFALDMYGKGVFGSDNDVEGNTALINPFASDRTVLRQRVNAALTAVRDSSVSQHVKVDPSRVAAMGYCFGGMCALELARSGADVKGAISIHGLLDAGGVANETITAKVLVLHGHDDPMATPEQALKFETEMTEAGVDWQLHAYGNTVHAFTNPGANNPDFGTVYSETAHRRSTRSIENFLSEVFQ